MSQVLQKRIEHLEKCQKDFERKLNTLKKRREDAEDHQDTSTTFSSISEAVSNLAVMLGRAAIPPLPEYRGDVKSWPLFERAFIQSCEEGQFPESQKIARLRAAIKSPALEQVESTLLFATTAKEVMDELRLEYGSFMIAQL